MKSEYDFLRIVYIHKHKYMKEELNMLSIDILKYTRMKKLNKINDIFRI